MLPEKKAGTPIMSASAKAVDHVFAYVWEKLILKGCPQKHVNTYRTPLS